MKPRQVLQIFTVAQEKTEPKSLVIVRTVITILFFAVLIGYMYVQIVDVRLDTPVFSTIQSRDEEKMIPMPNLHFTYEHQFTITCEINGRVTKTLSEDCLTRLQQPKLSQGIYEGIFKADGLNFIRNDVETLEFTFTVNNPGEIPITDLGIGLRIFDSKVQDPLDIENYKETNTHVIDNLLSLIDLNFYRLSSQQYHIIELSRIRRNVIKEAWWNILGIPPSYMDETYLNSQLETHPFVSFDASTNSYAKLILEMRSWRVPIEKEQKAKTLFDTIGQIAGVAGTLSILYAFLFGAGPSAIQSWGVVQKMKCFGIKKGVRKHINRRYPRLPFVHTSKTIKDDEIDENVNDYDEVLERLDAVERFLKEYVVDADFLEQLEKLDTENKNNGK
ncbi:hypothetical protein C1645_749760 [Glomus cerebriforme]|uniref:Uncharacterized protein n=1 Tax=Glomus cerebriforme TaxID=658196 RepID=A0A397TUJ4_9GLOM|nr:hypothetical protein C1645_749760 [Glomus cerebriforme]